MIQLVDTGFLLRICSRRLGKTVGALGRFFRECRFYKLEVIRYEIFATNSSIKRFTCSGLSVLELCPAPSTHVKGIFVLRYHALLYRILDIILSHSFAVYYLGLNLTTIFSLRYKIHNCNNLLLI